MNDLYREVILQEVAEPQNVGKLAHPTHERAETNASCGDQVTVQLEVTSVSNGEESAVIKNMAWQGNGCAISQASMSLLSEVVIGKSVTEVKSLTDKTVLNLLGLEEINPGREKCMMLGLKAVQRALEQGEKS